MFERFTDRARRVVVLAQENSRLLNHDHIGTEHLLLGLLQLDESTASRALQNVGVSLEVMRADVDQIIGEAPGKSPGHLPFTPRVKQVFEFALRESLQLGQNHIGTEHLLLGLLREGEGLACQILTRREVDLKKLRSVVVDLMTSEPRAPMASGEVRPITVAMGFEGQVSPDDMPLCPGCRSSLMGSLGSRVILIEPPTHRLFVVYCRTCGVALETQIEVASG